MTYDTVYYQMYNRKYFIVFIQVDDLYLTVLWMVIHLVHLLLRLQPRKKLSDVDESKVDDQLFSKKKKKKTFVTEKNIDSGISFIFCTLKKSN